MGLVLGQILPENPRTSQENKPLITTLNYRSMRSSITDAERMSAMIQQQLQMTIVGAATGYRRL